MTRELAIKSPIDEELVQELVAIYNKKVPSNEWTTYQEGVKAGIRYALLATNQKIEGINARQEDECK